MILKTASLPPNILHIVRDKGTEAAFTQEDDDAYQSGRYLCRQCGLALFRVEAKFPSGCGWPSFDSDIEGAVSKQVDRDGQRMEVVCSRCHAHLGHVFQGEGFTPKNIRHCINSLALDFVTDSNIKDTEEAIFAAGCFWGVESQFKKLVGVVKTEVGYTGGYKDHPSYNEVCTGATGHAEAIRVLYDTAKLNYETLIKYFFEIHDATQANGQGFDVGEQYRSKIFYYNDVQKMAAEKLVATLKKQGRPIVTQILPVSIFWHAEEYHQNYCQKNM